LYDLENIATPVFEQQAHVGIINAIDGCGGVGIGFGAPEIVTGTEHAKEVYAMITIRY